jgi:hypothetical protein
MFQIIDRENNFTPVKSGFKTASQANNWAKKNLPKDEVQLWGSEWKLPKCYRYFVRMR